MVSTPTEGNWPVTFPGNLRWSNATQIVKGMVAYGAAAMAEVDLIVQRLKGRVGDADKGFHTLRVGSLAAQINPDGNICPHLFDDIAGAEQQVAIDVADRHRAVVDRFRRIGTDDDRKRRMLRQRSHTDNAERT